MGMGEMCAVAITVPGSGPFTYFLALDGVAGNSTDPSRLGALRVESYKFEVTQSATALGGPGVSTFGPLTLFMEDDTALARMLALLALHQHVSGATLTARTTGAGAFDAYKLDLEDV